MSAWRTLLSASTAGPRLAARCETTMIAAGVIAKAAVIRLATEMRAPSIRHCQPCIRSKQGQGFGADGVTVARPAGQQHRLCMAGRRYQRAPMVEPRPHRLGRHLLLRNAVLPCGPPPSDLAHDRQQDFVDAVGQPDSLDSLREKAGNGGRVEPLRSIEHGLPETRDLIDTRSRRIQLSD